MNPEMTRATAPAVAQKNPATRFYHRASQQANTINDILAALIFSLHSPHVTVTERTTVFNVLDDLIRLKIDAGLLKEVHHAE